MNPIGKGGAAAAAVTLISYLCSIASGPAGSPSAGQPQARDSVEEQGRDTLSADSAAVELDEMVVVSTRSLTHSDGATLTYNVSEDPEAQSSNILDILRKVPGVTVDAEDNVKVNGQSNFKILINNREDPMLSGDIKSVLKSMPAGTIKKIEVISEPGARYEAEGVGGILNIVTDTSRKLSGFTTRLNGWVSNYQAGGSVNGRFKINKVMLGANVTYNNGNVWPASSYSETRIEDLQGGPNHLRVNPRKSKNGYQYTGMNLNMSWEPDTLNLFTLSGNLSDMSQSTRMREEPRMYGPDMSELWSMTRMMRSDYSNLGGGMQASYQRTFGRADNTLVLSYMLESGRNANIQRYEVENMTGAVEESPYSELPQHGGYVNHIAQIDYSNRLGQAHKLETGGKMSLNSMRRRNEFRRGASKEDMVTDGSQSVNLRQFRDIYALYASYTGSYSKWNLTAGLRYEYTHMGLRYRQGDYPDFTTGLHDLVPNAALSYNITDASALRVAYQMRISRPGIWSLNPFRDTSTPGYVQYGNPDLKSEKGHNISLGYTNYDNALTGGVKVTYRHVANSISDIMFMRDNILNSTYANIGRSQTVVFETNGDWSITPSLRWSVWFGAWYDYIKADSEMLKAKNKGWNYNVNSDISYTLPCKLRLSAYGGWFSGWLDLQSSGKGSYWYGVGASRSWLKDDALTLSLSAGNLFPLWRRREYTQGDESVRYTNSVRYRQWNVGLSVIFQFGALKADVKRTAANVQADDQGSGGSGKK